MKYLNFRIIFILYFAAIITNCTAQKTYLPHLDSDEKLNAMKLDSTLTSRLVTIGKVWGFTKYHHPRLASGNYDIDKELFLLVSNTLPAVNNRIFSDSLLNWSQSFGDFDFTPQKYQKYQDTIEYRRVTESAWIGNSASLGIALSEYLQSMSYAKRSKGNFISGGRAGTLDFSEEVVYDHLKAMNINYRLLTLFRFWNVIEYYYPYRPKNWNYVLKQYVDKFWNVNSYEEYVDVTRELIAEIEDSHARSTASNQPSSRFIPIETRFIKNHFFVISNSPYNTIPNGSEIISIGGVNSRKIRSELSERWHMSQSNEAAADRDMSVYGLMTDSLNIDIVYSNGGNMYQQRVRTIPLDSAHIFKNSYNQTIAACQMLNDTVAYINAGAFEYSRAEEYYQMIKNSSVIIFDMRFYPKTQMFGWLFNYFVSNNSHVATFLIPMDKLPGHFAYAEFNARSQSNEKYRGRVKVIVNEQTMSQGEYVTMMLQTCKNTETYGSSMTAGTDGDIAMLPLPCQMQTYITGIGILYPDKGQTQHCGIKIDKIVDPLVENNHYYNPHEIARIMSQ